MAESIPNLWPSGISETVETPLAILRAQVEPLRNVTNGLLRVNISTIASEETAQVVHSLDVVAPGLNNDRHRIVSVTHSRDRVYPARIETKGFEPKPKPGSFLPTKARQNVLKGFSGEPNDWRLVADSEGAFIKSLGLVLGSPEVRSVIDSLLARLNEREGVASPETTEP